MIIKVNDEHNFFLFQDIVEYFLLTLKHQWYFPIKSIHEKGQYPYYNASYYIYNSWYELLKERLVKTDYTELGKKLLTKTTDWMITTNVAILKAQIGRKTERVNQSDYEYIEKYKSTFLIEHSEDYNTYFVYLDGEIVLLFNEAINYWNSFEDFNTDNFYRLLSRYYVVDNSIEDVIDIVCKNYAQNKKDYFLSTYEILEDEQ